MTEIPFDESKIDQRFVHGAHNESTRCTTFDASLGLAKQLHMEAVAEGVEDRADSDFLKNKDCDIAQGYFISKALAPSEIGAWLTSWELRCVGLMEPVNDRNGIKAMVVQAGFKH